MHLMDFGLVRGAVLGIAALVAMAPSALTAQILDLKAGHARSMTLSGNAHTVTVGNADIASASVAFPNALMLIGRTPGTTNVVVLDENGSEIGNAILRVVRADGRQTIAVFRAGQNQTYLCRPEPGCLAVATMTQEIPYGQTSDPAAGAAWQADYRELTPR
jgi:hypothetical protein